MTCFRTADREVGLADAGLAFEQHARARSTGNAPATRRA